MTTTQLFRALRRRRLARNAARTRAGQAGQAGQAGMTLLEIMIVLAILALVMGLLVGPRVMAMFGESRVSLARTHAKQLADEAYVQWSVNNPAKLCPDSLNELTKYTNKKDVKDPWGSEFKMHCGDSAPEGRGFGISSKGPDGKEGTDDDVRSWADQ